MKVCFVSHSSAKAGAERALFELIEALQDKDVKAYVLLPSYGPLVKDLKSQKIDFDVLLYRWWMGRSVMWKRIVRVVLNLIMTVPVTIKIAQSRCDIVYTNTITVCIGALAAKLLGRPHVWHIHEFGYEDHHLVFDLGQRFSLWMMNKTSSVCIANSKAVAREYGKYIPLSKLRVIYQSVNVAPYIEKPILRERKDELVRCVIVGRLQEGKRQEDAIRALADLINAGIKAELVIVGDGDSTYRTYLHDLISENKLVRYVKFTGYVENPLPFMRDADVVLIYSRSEAFGRVTVEAMKVGKPVIGAKGGGTEELIREGFNDFLYSPGDHKELAEKIKYLYKHPDIARQMGENGRQWAQEQFTQERYGKEMLDIFRQFDKSSSDTP